MIARLNIGGPAVHATLLTTRLDWLRFSTTLVTGIEAVDDGNYLTLRGRQADLEIDLPASATRFGCCRTCGRCRRWCA